MNLPESLLRLIFSLIEHIYPLNSYLFTRFSDSKRRIHTSKSLMKCLCLVKIRCIFKRKYIRLLLLLLLLNAIYYNEIAIVLSYRSRILLHHLFDFFLVLRAKFGIFPFLHDVHNFLKLALI